MPESFVLGFLLLEVLFGALAMGKVSRLPPEDPHEYGESAKFRVISRAVTQRRTLTLGRFVFNSVACAQVKGKRPTCTLHRASLSDETFFDLHLARKANRKNSNNEALPEGYALRACTQPFDLDDELEDVSDCDEPVSSYHLVF